MNYGWQYVWDKSAESIQAGCLGTVLGVDVRELCWEWIYEDCVGTRWLWTVLGSAFHGLCWDQMSGDFVGARCLETVLGQDVCGLC